MPVPEVVNIIHSHENPLYEGATFSLICVISPNKTGVDIDFKVQKNFSGPVISASTLFDTVISVNNIQISMMFAPLSMNDTGTCLLYTSPSPRDATLSRMPSSA